MVTAAMPEEMHERYSKELWEKRSAQIPVGVRWLTLDEMGEMDVGEPVAFHHVIDGATCQPGYARLAGWHFIVDVGKPAVIIAIEMLDGTGYLRRIWPSNYSDGFRWRTVAISELEGVDLPPLQEIFRGLRELRLRWKSMRFPPEGTGVNDGC